MRARSAAFAMLLVLAVIAAGCGAASDEPPVDEFNGMTEDGTAPADDFDQPPVADPPPAVDESPPFDEPDPASPPADLGDEDDEEAGQ